MRVLFFGRLAEIAGGRETPFTAPALTAGEVAHALAQDRPGLMEALLAPGVRVAINQRLAPDLWSAPVAPGDEIAFMPAMSGG